MEIPFLRDGEPLKSSKFYAVSLLIEMRLLDSRYWDFGVYELPGAAIRAVTLWLDADVACGRTSAG